MSRRPIVRLGILVGFVGLAAAAEALEVGERAPDFALPDHTGRMVRLGDYLGRRHVVLAFYIRAFTPG